MAPSGAIKRKCIVLDDPGGAGAQIASARLVCARCAL
jgi:hypothetical protein